MPSTRLCNISFASAGTHPVAPRAPNRHLSIDRQAHSRVVAACGTGASSFAARRLLQGRCRDVAHCKQMASRADRAAKLFDSAANVALSSSLRESQYIATLQRLIRCFMVGLEIIVHKLGLHFRVEEKA